MHAASIPFCPRSILHEVEKVSKVALVCLKHPFSYFDSIPYIQRVPTTLRSPFPLQPPPLLSHHGPKSRNQRLRQPKTKHQLRSRHQQFRRQPFKKPPHAFLPRHIPNNPQPTLLVLEILILNPRLDDIQRRRNQQTRTRTTYRRHEILRPRRGIIIG